MIITQMPRTLRHYWPALLLISVLSLMGLAAGSGTIVSLSTSGGSAHGDTITISLTVRAGDRINKSNLFFEIVAPDGTVVATHSADPPKLEAGETFSYNWTSNNSGYPLTGDYTLNVCWSPGNAQNCSIGQASTAFYSVPTFGTVLTVVALVIFAAWLWLVRHKLFGRFVGSQRV